MPCMCLASHSCISPKLHLQPSHLVTGTEAAQQDFQDELRTIGTLLSWLVERSEDQQLHCLLERLTRLIKAAMMRAQVGAGEMVGSAVLVSEAVM